MIDIPKYDYRCNACHNVIELTHGFHDAIVDVCPECGVGNLKKLITPAPVHFNGSGFYRTDNRK